MVDMFASQRSVIHQLFHDGAHARPVVTAGTLDALLVGFELRGFLECSWHLSGSKVFETDVGNLPQLGCLDGGERGCVGARQVHGETALLDDAAQEETDSSAHVQPNSPKHFG